MPNNFKFREGFLDLKFDMIVTCPFCLEYNVFSSFKKVSGLFECPVCKNQLFKTSLILDLSSNEDLAKFVKFVFDYRLTGFWQKLYPSFEAWNRKLKEYGISFDFWENYKRLKGVSVNEENENEDNSY